MDRLLAFACMGLIFLAPIVATAGPQQDRMRACNQEAKEKALKGDERKAFMKSCLSNKAGAPAGDQNVEAAPGGKRHSQREK